jgi:hypothetical protein
LSWSAYNAIKLVQKQFFLIVLNLTTYYLILSSFLNLNLIHMKNLFSYLLLLAFVGLLAGTAQGQDRQVEAFDRLSISIPGDIELRQGSTHSLSIEASDEVLEEIVTEVKNGHLRIRMKESNWNWWGRKAESIKVYITVPSLKELSLAGSGKLKGIGTFRSDALSCQISGSGKMDLDIDTRELETHISGSGDMIFSGKAETMEASISGSGSILAEELRTESCKVRISGSGSSKVNASKELDASISGSGHIQYSGSPAQLNVHTSGSGKIRKAS